MCWHLLISALLWSVLIPAPRKGLDAIARVRLRSVRIAEPHTPRECPNTAVAATVCIDITRLAACRIRHSCAKWVHAVSEHVISAIDHFETSELKHETHIYACWHLETEFMWNLKQ